MIAIPRRWEQWAKTLVGGMISGGATAALASLSLAAEHAAGVNTQIQQFNLGQIEHQFVAGAIIGALMFLSKSPVPTDSTGNTETFTKPSGSGAAPEPR